MLLKEEAVWLACAIDGEGTVSVSKAARRGKTQTVYIPTINVANCNVAFVARAKELIRRACGAGHISKAHKGVNYPVWKAEVVSQRACELLLKAVLPHMIIKKRRAEAVLAWIADRKEARKRRPTRGGGTPYGEETVRLVQFLRNDPLDQ